VDPVLHRSWQPKPAAIAALGFAGAVLAIGCTTVVTDSPGRILSGVAAVGLLVFAGGSWRARPKLAITEAGLEIRGWWGIRRVHRDEIRRIRITEFRRIGRTVRLLEIDTIDDRLSVFTRWDLGTDPLDVLDALTAAGYVR
jgi:hypothetical protein